MRILTGFALLGLLLLVAGTSRAEDPGEPVAGRPGPTLHGELALSVRDAIAMAIENNLDVEIARFGPPIADFDHTSAWGVYDPNLFGNFDYSRTKTPVASSLQAEPLLTEREMIGAAGLAGLIPKVGAEYEVSYGGQRLESTSSIQDLSPEYRATILGTLSFPLLKGAWWGEPWVAVKQTGIGAEIADEEFRRALMDLTQATENAYWAVSAAAEQRRVAKKTLEARQALLDQTEAQYEVGVVSQVEVVQAEAGVAEGEVGLIVAENEYRTAQDRLIDVVLGPSLTPDSRLEIRPTDSPEEIVDYQVDPEEANRKALAHRPEIAQARKAVEQQEIELKFRRNQRLPKIDLKFTYGYQGLAGRTNPAPPLSISGQTQRDPITSVRRGFWHADDDFFGSDGADQYSAGATLTIPIGNRTGRAGVSKAQLELRRARTQVRRLELDIVLEVREAIRNLESALEGIEAAERRRAAAEEQRRAEAIRLQYGESTPFDVLQREEVLVDAESQKIGALQLYHNSVTALDRAQGTILRNRNIAVEEAAALR